jgi:hypothetical protein
MEQGVKSTPGAVGRAGTLVAGLLAFVVSFEGTARVDDLLRYGMPLMAPYASEGELVVHDSLGVHGRPKAQYLKWALNSLGTRGPEVSRRRPPDVLRVVATGASETFGQSESAGREFPRQLEDSLRERMRRGHLGPFTSIEVLNVAFFGMTLPTAIQDVRLRVGGFEPQIVVLYPTSVQYLSDAVPQAVLPRTGAAPVPGVAASLRPRVLMRLREELKRLAPIAWREQLWLRTVRREEAAHGPGWRFASVPQDRLAAYEADLRRFVGTVRSIGATPVLATHANRFVGGTVIDSSLLAAWERFYPRSQGQVLLAFDSAGAEVTRRVARDSGVVLADTREALRGCSGCFAEYAHFTDEGAARVARTIGAAIEGSLP